MRTPEELQAKLAWADEKMNERDVSAAYRGYLERFAIKLRVVLAFPMLTEREVCARLDGYITKMEQPGLKASKVMFWASEAAYLQWILQPPEPVVDEAVLARAQEKSNATGKPVYVWADPNGTHTATKRPGRKCKMLVPEEATARRNKGPRVHIPKGVDGYYPAKDTRTYAQRKAKAAERAVP